MLRSLILCIIVTGAVPTVFTQEATPVHVHLSARDIPKSDPFNGSPDAYVIISYAFGGGEQFKTVGNTSVINDSINPNWTEFYNFGFVPGLSQRLRFEVWDEDLDSDDYIGDVQFFLAELSRAENRTLVKPIQPGGNGILVISNFVNSTLYIPPKPNGY